LASSEALLTWPVITGHSSASLSPDSGKSIDGLDPNMPFDAIDGSDREILMRRHDNSPLLSTQKPRPLGGRDFLTGQEGAISRRR
jgi:hypothetical protein